MYYQSCPSTANTRTNMRTTKTNARVPTNHIPYPFSQTRVQASHCHMPFSSRIIERMQHRQLNNSGVNKMHTSYTALPSFTRATSPSCLFARKQVVIADNSRRGALYTSLTRDMYAGKSELHRTSLTNTPNSLKIFSNNKTKSVIDFQQNTLQSHLHRSNYVNTSNHHNDNERCHVCVNANATRVSRCSNGNRNNSKWQVHDT